MRAKEAEGRIVGCQDFARKEMADSAYAVPGDLRQAEKEVEMEDACTQLQQILSSAPHESGQPKCRHER